MMLPGVTVVPATVWLAVCVAMVGASNLHPSRLTPDQYAPLISHRHGLHRGTEEDQPLSKFLNDSDEDQYIEDMAGLQPNQQGPAKNRPVSISISTYWKDQDVADQDVADQDAADQAVADQADLSMRKSSSTGRLFAPQDLELLKHLEKNLLHLRMENSAAEDLSPLLQDKQLLEYAGQQLLDQNNNVQETPEPARSPPRESPPQPEDPFVADDTFQDQGPGSVEIYKLDLLRERLLPNPMPASKLSMNGKSKVPKKTVQSNEKTKATEYKPASPKMFHKQSNSFDDHSSDTPPIADPFSVGGVPELQVGCEGLAASRQKRSIDSASKDQEGDLWSEVTPISLDLDYDLSEEKYEVIDELFKLKKLETTTKGPKQNRGDIDAEFESEKPVDELPIRGDLGKSSADSATLTPMTFRNERKSEEPRGNAKVKRSVQSEDTPTGERPGNQMRKILWIKEPILNEPSANVDPSEPGSWGFGENEGVVSSDELQTENQRRRQLYEQSMAQGELRRRQEGQSRGLQDRSRSDREELPEQGQTEEKRSVPQDSPWQREDERRRLEEERNRRIERRREEAFARSQGWTQQTSRPRWEQQEEEARRRQHEEEARRRQREEEARRRQHEEEARRRQHEEEARRRQEWMLKTRQREEEERRKQARDRSQPSNTSVAANENGPHGQWEREKKLREHTWNRKRLEEERKLQDYVRRNQPVVIPRNVTNDSAMYWRRMQEAGRDDRSRYPSIGGGRRDHGPSATTNFLPRSYEDEARRRNAAWRTERERTRERLEEQRLGEQRLREEARRRELEFQRLQSRRYEEERRRIEAERRAAQQHAGRTSPLENTGSTYWDRRRLEDHSRRQETNLVPINLVANETRRAAEHERMVEEQRRRMEDNRRRIEDARRRPGGYRAKEARENQERARDEREQRRRQEVARLNALPVLASIIIRPGARPPPPRIGSRIFGDDIEYTGLNPSGKGLAVPNFPAAPTGRPPVKSPPPCVWAVVKCCPSSTNRLVMCFESMGCPGVNWDPNPCRISITKAARQQVMQFYEESEEDDDF